MFQNEQTRRPNNNDNKRHKTIRKRLRTIKTGRTKMKMKWTRYKKTNKPKNIRSKGSGWHKQPVRHSRARKTGKAGGKYASERILTMLKKNPKLKNMTFKQLKNKGIFLRYQSDSDKDKTPNIKDCQPLNPKKQEKKQEINARIKSLKLMLIKKAKSKGIYENFGRKEVRILQDEYPYLNVGKKEECYNNSLIGEFDDWAMNFDQKELEKYKKDSDGDGVPDKLDCEPHNPKMQDLKETIKKGEKKTEELLKKGFKKAKEFAKEELPKIKELTKKARKKVEKIWEEHKEKRAEAVEKAIEEATKGRLIPEREKIKEEVTEKILEPTTTKIKYTGIGRIPEGTEGEYITQFFQEQKPIFDPEEARRIAEKTLKAMEEVKHKQIEQIKDVSVEEFTDEELKKIATRLGTGTLRRGNKYLNEIKRRIRQREKIKADLEIELMIAQKESKKRIDEEIKRGTKAGGYIWDDWFK